MRVGDNIGSIQARDVNPQPKSVPSWENVLSSVHDEIKERDRETAEKLGIQWERPSGDNCSAQDIINDSPLLRNLGNQSGIKDMLKERVGDFEKDADAAYRAIQVLEHVEKFDEDGNRLAND
ncbi:hypothetical protein ACJ7V3_18420, partial [Halomonas elongata]|uniref:hypothetical protein n=1 Tax=Halomonas elongata TaxID=2746 RepID=UPI0038D50479